LHQPKPGLPHYHYASRKICRRSFAQAFAQNPLQYDVFQVVGPNGAGIFHVDYTGAAYSDQSKPQRLPNIWRRRN
jgi:hypothetical protein